MEDESKKPDKKPDKMPEMTPEQKAKIDSVGLTVGKLNKMTTPFLFNQLQMIEDGEIHIHLIVNEFDVSTIDFHSRLARDLTVRTVMKVEEPSEKEPEGAKES